MQKITEFELISHGMLSSSDDFQGYGVAWTAYTDIATGVGDTVEEATDDCLERMATAGDFDLDDMPARILIAYGESLATTVSDVVDDEGSFFFVSIRYNHG